MSSSSSTTSITLSIPGQERRSKFISFVNSRNLIGYNIYHRHRNQNYTSATITKDYLIQHEHGEKQFKTLSAAAVDVVKKLSNDKKDLQVKRCGWKFWMIQGYELRELLSRPDIKLKDPNSTTTVNAKEKNNCKASESDANILLQFTNQIGIRGGISVQHILNNNNNNTNNVLISSSAEEIDDRDEESFDDDDDDDDDNHFLSPLSSSSLSSNKNNGIHQTNDIQDKRTTMKRHNKKHRKLKTNWKSYANLDRDGLLEAEKQIDNQLKNKEMELQIAKKKLSYKSNIRNNELSSSSSSSSSSSTNIGNSMFDSVTHERMFQEKIQKTAIYQCEKGCGFMSDYKTVLKHEETCMHQIRNTKKRSSTSVTSNSTSINTSTTTTKTETTKTQRNINRERNATYDLLSSNMKTTEKHNLQQLNEPLLQHNTARRNKGSKPSDTHKRKAQLKAQLNTKNSNTKKNVHDPNRYKCSICINDLPYAGASGLWYHMRNFHGAYARRYRKRMRDNGPGSHTDKIDQTKWKRRKSRK